MRKSLALTVAVDATLAVALAAVATAMPSTLLPTLLVKFGGGVTPKTLPKHALAPVALRIRGSISTENGTQPSAFREAIIDFDKNGRINAKGLPVCKRKQLEAYTKATRRVCGKSIVGTGIAHVEIASSEQLPVALTLFNGGVKAGMTTVFIHAVIGTPTPLPIVATVKIRKIHKGRFGLQTVSKIPRLVNGSGSVLNFSFKIKRLFRHMGTKQSYVMARCPDRHLDAKIIKAVFRDEAGSGAGNETVAGTASRACTPAD